MRRWVDNPTRRPAAGSASNATEAASGWQAVRVRAGGGGERRDSRVHEMLKISKEVTDVDRMASSDAKDSQGHPNALNALGMRSDCPSKQPESRDTSMGSRSHERGTGKRTCVAKSEKVVQSW